MLDSLCEIIDSLNRPYALLKSFTKNSKKANLYLETSTESFKMAALLLYEVT
ncbi:hypothetical protein PAUR_a2390 [Pseudoalteromonas aurantia 208]|uniref:Uncharacterized protein n=1 Tax=Pseudoalteromonas aurantia 208 TaxID=1314867 RepID=A0ABR9ECJ4_9GAMM|nr:hypothetical protein [Pseudoalteromonas aurantia 208]